VFGLPFGIYLIGNRSVIVTQDTAGDRAKCISATICDRELRALLAGLVGGGVVPGAGARLAAVRPVLVLRRRPPASPGYRRDRIWGHCRSAKPRAADKVGVQGPSNIELVPGARRNLQHALLKYAQDRGGCPPGRSGSSRNTPLGSPA
jgi:hypothetical protein